MRAPMASSHPIIPFQRQTRQHQREQAHLRGGAQLYLVGASAAVRYFSTVGTVYGVPTAGWISITLRSSRPKVSDSQIHTRPRQPWSNRTGLEEVRYVRYGDEVLAASYKDERKRRGERLG